MKMWLLPVILLGLTIQAVAGPLRVYLAPAGDDLSDGFSEERPIKSLARAQEVVVQALGSQPNDAEIRITPGTYSGQTVRWSFYPCLSPTVNGALDTRSAHWHFP